MKNSLLIYFLIFCAIYCSFIEPLIAVQWAMIPNKLDKIEEKKTTLLEAAERRETESSVSYTVRPKPPPITDPVRAPTHQGVTAPKRPTATP